MKIQNLKELILLGVSTVLLLGLVGVFIYMVNTENSKERMMNMLSPLQMKIEKQKDTKEELDASILEKDKFRELEITPSSDQEFDSGKRNPFQGSEKEVVEETE